MNDARVANKNLLFDVGVRPNRRLLALLEYDLDQALPWVDSNCLHLALSSLRMMQDVERPQANEEHWHMWESSYTTADDCASKLAKEKLVKART
jgi:hypothetical protein